MPVDCVLHLVMEGQALGLKVWKRVPFCIVAIPELES